MDRIAATLGLKEMSQRVLVRKICTLSWHHRTRKAIFELDKLIRSIYTLRYFRDPQLQCDVHRSENRIESYHQLCSTIAQVNGKKELTGGTDLDVAVSNHCGRLIVNVVIAYNSMLLSGLLGRYLATGNEKTLGTYCGESRQRRGRTCISLDTTHSATSESRLIWKLFWLGLTGSS